MKYKDAIIAAIALAIGLTSLTGMAYSSAFQRAAVVEHAGFDALAHDLFDRSRMACADTGAPAAQ